MLVHVDQLLRRVNNEPAMALARGVLLVVVLCLSANPALSLKKESSSEYVYYESPNRPGTPMFINPFGGRLGSDHENKPISWVDIYKRNEYVKHYKYYAYIPPNWNHCMESSPVSLECQAYYQYIFDFWPWSKRLMPKIAYETEDGEEY